MSLPSEILQDILTKVPGKELITCREVCKTWKLAVDSLPDIQWKSICEKELRHTKKIHDSSRITWFQTFKALHSWKNIKDAALDCRELPQPQVQQLKILPGVIAVLIDAKENNQGNANHGGSSIVYYTMDTMLEINRNTFTNRISYFDENEHLLILKRYHTEEMYLVNKANNNRYNLGNTSTFNTEIKLVDKTAFYYNHNYHYVYKSQLKNTNGGTTINTTPLNGSRKMIQNFIPHCLATGLVSILSDGIDGFRRCVDILSFKLHFGLIQDQLSIFCTKTGYVYCYDNDSEELNEVTQLWEFGEVPDNLRTELTRYGFDWTSFELYSDPQIENAVQLTPRAKCACLHANLVFIGTDNGVELYLDPYNADGDLAMDGATPTRKVNLRQHFADGDDSATWQIKVVERADHHLVITYFGNKVVLLRFEFEGNTRKRKHETPNACESKRRRV